MTSEYHNRTMKDYPMLVYLNEEGSHFKTMVKQYRHGYAGCWTYIQFPNNEDMLGFMLMFERHFRPKARWKGDLEHYILCDNTFPPEVSNKYNN